MQPWMRSEAPLFTSYGGAFDASGAWDHNPYLMMTREEQFRQNVNNGFHPMTADHLAQNQTTSAAYEGIRLVHNSVWADDEVEHLHNRPEEPESADGPMEMLAMALVGVGVLTVVGLCFAFQVGWL